MFERLLDAYRLLSKGQLSSLYDKIKTMRNIAFNVMITQSVIFLVYMYFHGFVGWFFGLVLVPMGAHLVLSVMDFMVMRVLAEKVLEDIIWGDEDEI